MSVYLVIKVMTVYEKAHNILNFLTPLSNEKSDVLLPNFKPKS